MENDPKIIKKEEKLIKIDVHSADKALVLTYQLSVVLSFRGQTYAEQRNLQRLINFPNLTPKSNCYGLAIETVEKCSLLSSMHVPQLQELLFTIKNRKFCKAVDVPVSLSSSLNSQNGNNVDEKANFNRINEYIEMFYEDLNLKIKASSLILQIAKDHANLGELSKNEALLSSLARVLRECWKKSIVLSTNIVYVFFCFSIYIDFHFIIIKYKIGSKCMEVLSFEIQRYEKWRKDLEILLENQNRSPKRSSSQQEITPKRCRIPQLIRPKSGNWSETSISIDNLPPTPSTSSSSSSSLIGSIIDSDEDRIKRLKQSIKKQEQLLRVTVYLLLNLADNRKIEAKMVGKGFVAKLLSLLNRDNDDLIILVITFLLKLSDIYENKERMKELKILEQLLPFLKHTNTEVTHQVLRLLYNLTFDRQLLKDMIRLKMFYLFLDLFGQEKHQETVTKLFYQLSCTHFGKELFAVTNSVILIIDMILLSRENVINKTLLAVAINLALTESNASKMIENDRLPILIKKSFRSKDEMLVHLLRNISEHQPLKKQFLDYVGDFAKILTVETQNQQFRINCMIVFGNIRVPELDYWQIINEFKLVDMFKIDLQVTNDANFDIVYETIVLLGTLVQDEQCAIQFCRRDFLAKLIELLKFYQEDDKTVLQILRVFYCVLVHKSTRHFVIENTEIIAYLIDLLNDNDEQVKKVSRSSLNIVKYHSPKWEERIKHELFSSYNCEWLKMIHILETNSKTSEPVQLALAKDYEYYHGKPDENNGLPSNMDMKFLRFSVMSDLIHENRDKDDDDDDDDDYDLLKASLQ